MQRSHILFTDLFKIADTLPTGMRTMLLILSILFVLAIIILVVVIISHLRRASRERRKKLLSAKFEVLLTTAMFEDADTVYVDNQEFAALLREINTKYLNSKLSRQVLIDQIIVLYHSVKGAARKNLGALYLELGLNHDSIAKLRSMYWYNKTKGIHELSMMDNNEASHLIKKYINHRKVDLRAEAQLTLVHLLHYDALEFLQKSKYPISEWEQLNLLNVLTRKEREEGVDFVPWLQSKNDSIINFTLKLIAHFKHKENALDILPLLLHPNETLRVNTAKTLGILGEKEVFEHMIIAYPKETQDVKVEILIAAQALATSANFDFLAKEVDSDNFQVSLRAAEALRFHMQGGKLKALAERTTRQKVKDVVEHVLDNRIYA